MHHRSNTNPISRQFALNVDLDRLDDALRRAVDERLDPEQVAEAALRLRLGIIAKALWALDHGADLGGSFDAADVERSFLAHMRETLDIIETSPKWLNRRLTADWLNARGFHAFVATAIERRDDESLTRIGKFFRSAADSSIRPGPQPEYSCAEIRRRYCETQDELRPFHRHCQGKRYSPEGIANWDWLVANQPTLADRIRQLDDWKPRVFDQRWNLSDFAADLVARETGHTAETVLKKARS